MASTGGTADGVRANPTGPAAERGHDPDSREPSGQDNPEHTAAREVIMGLGGWRKISRVVDWDSYLQRVRLVVHYAG